MAEFLDDPFNASSAPAQAGFMEQLNDPRVRGALLQMGLQMMQPLSPGQNQFGHIAQGIGAGGDFANRVEKMDLAEKVAEDRTDVAREKLESQGQIAGLRNQLGHSQLDERRTRHDQQLDQRGRRLDQYDRDLERKGIRDLISRNQSNTRDFDLFVREQSKGIAKQLENDLYAPATGKNPALERWRGKSQDQITRELMNDPGMQGEFMSRRERMTAPMGMSEGKTSDRETLRAQAKAAIARGVPRAEVSRMLKQLSGEGLPDDDD